MDSRLFNASSDPPPLAATSDPQPVPTASGPHPFQIATGLEPSILLHPAIVHLWNAFRLAQNISAEDPTRCQWEFAVDLAHLRQLGLGDSHLRWLILKGYVGHRELKALLPHTEQNGHSPAPRLLFDDTTLLCLSPIGAALIESLNAALQSGAGMATAPSLLNGANGHGFPFDPIAVPTIDPHHVIDPDPGNHLTPLLPTWDADRRELHYAGQLVKQFKWRAPNQETILAAFQEENWPPRIDDPLSPAPEIDPKRRLHDTIKCLNRNQRHSLLHFRGDGSGEGVIWAFIDHI